MSVSEQIPDNGDKLRQRAHEWAIGAGEKAAGQAALLLARHSELIVPETATRIEAEEFNRSFEAALKARESGRLNDNYSTATGITIFMTKTAFEEAKENNQGSDSYMAGYLETVEPIDEEDSLYALRLSEGAYSMGLGGCTFYGKASFEEKLRVVSEKPFSFPYGGIVRVEGDNGDLWQNADYQPDGSPIER